MSTCFWGICTVPLETFLHISLYKKTMPFSLKQTKIWYFELIRSCIWTKVCCKVHWSLLSFAHLVIVWSYYFAPSYYYIRIFHNQHMRNYILCITIGFVSCIVVACIHKILHLDTRFHLWLSLRIRNLAQCTSMLLIYWPKLWKSGQMPMLNSIILRNCLGIYHPRLSPRILQQPLHKVLMLWTKSWRNNPVSSSGITSIIFLKQVSLFSLQIHCCNLRFHW